MCKAQEHQAGRQAVRAAGQESMPAEVLVKYRHAGEADLVPMQL